MVIFLKAGGLLKDYLQPDVDAYTRKVEIQPGQSLSDILKNIGIRPSLVSMALINGKMVPMSYQPTENDIITLRPPVQGG